ncbi:YitT family protein [Halobacillus salinarum]|uniref:YitT family protein n=1 Tax=Halobacillus salinarum TaxID=2932257 RepID=A0ABY4ENB6_9BACI|nr:YitT family protein [Halobacillus salinarum]UOQ45954.1 YitT family protein [Halobacillus salinarum]
MKLIHKSATILFGSFLLSIGINFFLVPYELLDGGVIGLGLIINYLTGVQAGLIIIVLSLPIFIMAWIWDRSYFYNSLHGMLFSSFAIDLLAPLHTGFSLENYFSSLWSSITGGLFIGTGIGIMLRSKTSTGGTDLLAQFLAKLFRMNVGLVIFFIDIAVIGLGGILISSQSFALSAVTIIFVGIATSACTWNMGN